MKHRYKKGTEGVHNPLSLKLHLTWKCHHSNLASSFQSVTYMILIII